MNIAFLISGFCDGGIDTVVSNVTSMLAEDPKYKISLVIVNRMPGLEVYHNRLHKNVHVEYLVDETLLCEIRVKRKLKQLSPLAKFADEAILNPIRRLLIKSRLQKIVEKNDIIIDFDTCQTAFLKNCKKPTIAWYHFSLKKNHELNARRTDRIAKRLEQYDKVIMICKAMRDETNAMYPALTSHLSYIYNMVDLPTIDNVAKKTHDYLLAVERLEQSQKDIKTLLKAYSLLGNKIEEHLVIIGEGNDKDMLIEYAKSLGLTVNNAFNDGAKVHFVGFQNNVQEWMKGATMLVHSAFYEGLPTVLIESLLAGLPVVSTDCPTGPREILADGRAGMLTPVGDAEAMAAAIKSLLVDNSLRQDILEYAKDHVKTFTKDSIKPQLDKLFESCFS